MAQPPMTVVETERFFKDTAQFMSDGERSGTARTRVLRRRQTVGQNIIEGLEQAIAWSRGENTNARVTLVHVPDVDVRKVRTMMGLSQAQFATKFGFPPATLRNWEQGGRDRTLSRGCCWP